MPHDMIQWRALAFWKNKIKNVERFAVGHCEHSLHKRSLDTVGRASLYFFVNKVYNIRLNLIGS